MKVRAISALALCLSISAKASEKEIMCLAENIYHESRSQSIYGQIAVGHVTMNRVESRMFPNTVCEVVTQGEKKPSPRSGELVPVKNRCQFSWYCDGLKEEILEENAWHDAFMVAATVYTRDRDTTGGSMWYHADYVRPYWANSYLEIMRVDDHIFYTHR